MLQINKQRSNIGNRAWLHLKSAFTNGLLITAVYSDETETPVSNVRSKQLFSYWYADNIQREEAYTHVNVHYTYIYW